MTHTDRQTHRQTNKHTDTQTDRHTDRHIQTHIHTHRQTDTPMIAASSRLTAIAPFGNNVYNKKNRSASANNSTDVILPENYQNCNSP